MCIKTQIKWDDEIKNNIGFNFYRDDMAVSDNKIKIDSSGKIVPTTLSEDQFKLQKEKGCIVCHPQFTR